MIGMKTSWYNINNNLVLLLISKAGKQRKGGQTALGKNALRRCIARLAFSFVVPVQNAYDAVSRLTVRFSKKSPKNVTIGRRFLVFLSELVRNQRIFLFFVFSVAEIAQRDDGVRSWDAKDKRIEHDEW